MVCSWAKVGVTFGVLFNLCRPGITGLVAVVMTKKPFLALKGAGKSSVVAGLGLALVEKGFRLASLT